jgi:hypothetical protein
VRATVGAQTAFFDQYPRFYSTSQVGAVPNRLNQRHRVLIASSEEFIRRKSILDIGSHDGRWSFAALQTGAQHVLGIEGRPHLVAHAEANMREYGVPEGRFRFIVGDVFDELDRLEPGSIDTIFCFGFFYHTMHHMLLFSKIARLNPSSLILDTAIDADRHSLIRVRREDTSRDANAIGTVINNRIQLVGRPSRRALDLMLTNAGWSAAYYDWRAAGIRHWDALQDYRRGERLSLVAMSESAMADRSAGPAHLM